MSIRSGCFEIHDFQRAKRRGSWRAVMCSVAGAAGIFAGTFVGSYSKAEKFIAAAEVVAGGVRGEFAELVKKVEGLFGWWDDASREPFTGPIPIPRPRPKSFPLTVSHQHGLNGVSREYVHSIAPPPKPRRDLQQNPSDSLAADQRRD
jgi:hypothetical protein